MTFWWFFKVPWLSRKFYFSRFFRPCENPVYDTQLMTSSAKFCLCFVAFWWWGVGKCVWTILFCLMLTHWGQVMHIYVSKLTIIGSNNGLVSGQHQAIIWTNAGILLIWTLLVGTNFSGISSEIHTFSFKKQHLNVLSGQWWPFCLGLNVLHGGYMFQSVCISFLFDNDKCISVTALFGLKHHISEDKWSTYGISIRIVNKQNVFIFSHKHHIKMITVQYQIVKHISGKIFLVGRE